MAGKKMISIVGAIVDGTSGSGYFGSYTGSKTVLKEMGADGDIEIYMNSPGGSVFAGFEIKNALTSASKAGRAITIYVSPMAASIASYIAAGVEKAKVVIADNGKLMFHAPWTCMCGSKDEFRDMADLLAQMEDDLVAAVESRGAKADREWFAAGRAKWIPAKDAVAMKLADEIGYPPAELLAELSKRSSSYSYGTMWRDSAGREAADFTSPDRIAASASFAGVLAEMCREKFGDVSVGEIDSGAFRVTKNDGSSSLLKYRPDCLTIVAVDWESASFEPKQETDMSKPAQPPAQPETPAPAAQTPAPAPAQPETPAPAAQTPPPAPAQPETPAPAAQTPPPAPAQPAPSDGLTEDERAFARANYKIVRDRHLAAIKENPKNTFSDAELAEMSITTLEKIAGIAASDAKGQQAGEAPKPDNSLISPDAGAKGSCGSLPPPEL